MNQDNEHPEFVIGAFIPIGLGLAAVISAIVMLSIPGGIWRTVLFILTILLVAVSSGILGAIWVSRRNHQQQ